MIALYSLALFSILSVLEHLNRCLHKNIRKYMWAYSMISFKLHNNYFSDVFREATTDFTVDASPLTKTGGDHIKAQIANPSGASTDCLIKDNADGTYAVEFTPFERGEYYMLLFWRKAVVNRL